MNNCIQCNEPSKYKCPICRKPYCSVVCCKLHRSNPCIAPPTPNVESPTEPSREYEFPTDDTVPVERLELLRQSVDVNKCLENPHVREILKILDKSAYPDELMQEYMLEPIFTEFVDACLSVVQAPDNEKQ
ncbi:unnamed protein product [Chilo suppressalis]|uniref:HIT-type domain-containing protein n=1 Tax=Chilo suppressalis TaxID=168631 RepID=A0ABN8AU76_CHISP|nr:hypothetical protein evm_004437 [Chilo suppressalis]CAH0398278.1 unnamed protein product [Chilo suppressalis]